MKPPYASARSYREQEILTAPPERLVVMLFEGAVRFLTRARSDLERGDLAGFHSHLGRAEAIIDELLATLDLRQGEIAERLQAIYVFCKRQLAQARIARDGGGVARVAGWLGELRDAFAEAAKAAAPPAAASEATASGALRA